MSASARMGAQTKKTIERRGFMEKERPTPIKSITGLRTNGRSPPLMAFCKTVTSVVMRVMSEEVAKWSMLEKAYCCHAGKLGLADARAPAIGGAGGEAGVEQAADERKHRAYPHLRALI